MSEELLSHDQMSNILKVAIIISAAAAINWYSTNVLNTNFINKFLNKQDVVQQPLSKVERIIYTVIGVAGIIVLYGFWNNAIRLRVRQRL